MIRLLLTISSRVAAIALGLGLTSPAAAHAQTPSAQRPATQRPATQSPTMQAPRTPAAAGIDAARAQLAAGAADRALELANTALIANPLNVDATLLKIDALMALKRRGDAVTAYEQWRGASEKDDDGLLRALAKGVLWEIGSDDRDLAAPYALEALARAGDRNAREALVRQSKDAQDSGRAQQATLMLARLGEASALNALVTMASSESPNTASSALRELADANVSSAGPAVLKGLQSRNTFVQLSAARAAGRLKIASAKPTLVKLMAEGTFIVRLESAAALRALGDPQGDAVLKRSLTQPYPDATLMAARALAATADQSWTGSVKPLLANPDGLFRFQAAELLLSQDRAAAVDVLIKGTSDPNPMIRDEAARILAADPGTSTTTLTPLLRDQSSWARLHAARRLADGATRKPALSKKVAAGGPSSAFTRDRHWA